jgi:3-phenylpropionate/trans-cinnamate dioxygenase ferredoxin reductase subunit
LVSKDKRLVIVGGGYIGLEVAASAGAMGAQVTVLEREEHALARVASPQLSEWLVNEHRKRGTTVLTSADVASFRAGSDGSVAAVVLRDGRALACDGVLVGVGAAACTDLAAAAGIACDNGVVVDDQARTTVASVYAIGDMTRRPLHHYPGMFRLESIPSTVEQAKQAVASILGVTPPRAEVPWFWSDQFDLKLKIAGLLLEVDQTTVRGCMDTGKFALFHTSGDRVVAVEAVNSGAAFRAGRRLVDRGTTVDLARLGDDDVPLGDLVA